MTRRCLPRNRRAAWASGGGSPKRHSLPAMAMFWPRRRPSPSLPVPGLRCLASGTGHKLWMSITCSSWRGCRSHARPSRYRPACRHCLLSSAVMARLSLWLGANTPGLFQGGRRCRCLRGGGSGVEQALEPEPADHAAAHPLGDRGQRDLSDRSGGRRSASRAGWRSGFSPRAFSVPSRDAPAAAGPGRCGRSRARRSAAPWPGPGRSRRRRNTSGSCHWPRRGSSRTGRPRR